MCGPLAQFLPSVRRVPCQYEADPVSVILFVDLLRSDCKPLLSLFKWGLFKVKEPLFSLCKRTNSLQTLLVHMLVDFLARKL